MLFSEANPLIISVLQREMRKLFTCQLALNGQHNCQLVNLKAASFHLQARSRKMRFLSYVGFGSFVGQGCSHAQWLLSRSGENESRVWPSTSELTAEEYLICKNPGRPSALCSADLPLVKSNGRKRKNLV